MIHNCPECGSTIVMTNEDTLCMDCRIKAGLPPYEFLAVEITPFIKGAEQEEIMQDMSGNEYIEKYTPSSTGFCITWVARGVGFSTTEFWIEEDGWHTEDEPYDDGFLAEAMKFFFDNCKK